VALFGKALVFVSGVVIFRLGLSWCVSCCLSWSSCLWCCPVFVVSVVLVVTTPFYLNTKRASHNLERKTFCSTRLFHASSVVEESLSVGVTEFRYV
jgi:hypothetical protein